MVTRLTGYVHVYIVQTTLLEPGSQYFSGSLCNNIRLLAFDTAVASSYLG
jgi:hypothetical protein